ncbi:acetyl/propionyl/methylcrotonyl-CoA carboxylase subunit alpha [Streptomyces sp. NPDC058534]|uniref:acetyl-CoA carboxylase biotin carboxylase subunit n=1 Tax=Streptomyces sp. NPDC058534 TaxID=3346541 RepID=UPI00365E2E62
MFDTVLVAIRGEIAVRVIRTLRALGVRSVAVYSDADADARHVREADTAVRIGPPPAGESYLSVPALLDAARRTGARAIHPGYGFLAENAAFAQACADAGLVFIGPPASAISLMGDKIRAKETVKAAGVPVVPGAADPELAAAAWKLGAPVLLKPSAGGGGKGMRLVRDLSKLEEEIASARREARSSFGDDTLLVERWIDRPRHIEIQVLADGHGNVVHLGERECSLQRRHQKIIEEAPSVLLTPESRAGMGAAAVEAARSCGYVGAGTVQFIVPGGDPASYYFMEMNTRLQVEHPVTELITGIDLVEWQLRVAAGEELDFSQDEVRLDGWAIEARICAEDPSRGFLPSGGTVLALNEPQGNGVRSDSGLSAGTEVSSLYDPMLSKVIVHAKDRPTALRKLRAALADTVTLGVATNAGFLRRLLAHDDDDVVAGALDTGLVERDAQNLIPEGVPPEVYAAAALIRHFPRNTDQRRRRGPAGDWTDPFDARSGWRLGGQQAWTPHHFRLAGHAPARVRIRGNESNAQLMLAETELQPETHGAADPLDTASTAGIPSGAKPPGASGWLGAAGPWLAAFGGNPPAPGRVSGRGGVGEVFLSLDGVTHRFTVTPFPEGLWLGRDGDSWHVLDHDPVEAALSGARHGGADTLAAPMPGTVTVVKWPSGTRSRPGRACSSSRR